jgi:hypothetical protein
MGKGLKIALIAVAVLAVYRSRAVRLGQDGI